LEPESRFYYSQRPKLHYIVWGDEANPPLLLIHGGESPPYPAEQCQASAFHNHRSVAIPNAGHWVHHDQLQPFLAVVREFLA